MNPAGSTSSGARSASVRRVAEINQPRPVVLMVDDNAGDAILIELAMAEVGFDCTVVRVDNALLAYAFLQGTPPFVLASLPDLILLDLDLPIITGAEFLRKLRASPIWRDLAVLVFSASTRAEDAREALGLGALRCLPKPPMWSQYVHAAHAIHAAWLHRCGDAGTGLVAAARR